MDTKKERRMEEEREKLARELTLLEAGKLLSLPADHHRRKKEIREKF